MRWMLPLLVLMVPLASADAGFDSGDIAPGSAWGMTFDEVHEEGHTYHCHPHPWMTGMVHVAPDSDGEVATHEVVIDDSDPDPDNWGYSPQHLYIEVGDHVVWRNAGSDVHTATWMDGDHGDHGAHGNHTASGHGHDHAGHDHGSESVPVPVALGLAALGLALARRR